MSQCPNGRWLPTTQKIMEFPVSEGVPLSALLIDAGFEGYVEVEQ